MLAILSLPASAATITLTAQDSVQMAVIASATPRMSWGNREPKGIIYHAERIDLGPGMAILMKFPFEAIPKGQRILKAELVLMCEYVAGAPKLQVHRLLADWGPGVSFQHRRQFPSKIDWAQPGGRGVADRGPKATGSVVLVPPKENSIDVTQDIELWYTGSAPNHGWIIDIEKDAGITYLPSPYWPLGSGPKTWKLVITHEPL